MNQQPGGVHQPAPTVHPAFLKHREVGRQQFEQQERERRERLEAERAKALAEKAVDEGFDERWSQRIEGATAESIANGNAAIQAGLQRQAAEKQAHEAEIKILGKAIAAELKPEFQALIAAIREAVTQLKENPNVND
jgi:Na+-translocating ferredoxin:NAD+ oxidoreductase RnfC subunit